MRFSYADARLAGSCQIRGYIRWNNAVLAQSTHTTADLKRRLPSDSNSSTSSNAHEGGVHKRPRMAQFNSTIGHPFWDDRGQPHDEEEEEEEEEDDEELAVLYGHMQGDGDEDESEEEEEYSMFLEVISADG